MEEQFKPISIDVTEAEPKEFVFEDDHVEALFVIATLNGGNKTSSTTLSVEFDDPTEDGKINRTKVEVAKFEGVEAAQADIQFKATKENNIKLYVQGQGTVTVVGSSAKGGLFTLDDDDEEEEEEEEAAEEEEEAGDTTEEKAAQ
ncbi:hypothetical protein TRFO_28301 [Tritrichomonas foetus]|uniref:Nucleoplasmin-like domain-containing protein n=1 Tax=Tritrichomonas foetus TaxID=1144522 RepID=A0A1J4JZY3_9EUKA|nr:hypothetical protein TRFO_28301 [Tritrichomonas foetus]|eukprot:OHT04250.1 hypothetical protein TRFO_28301 [Tritrichomonas foetus]